MERYVIGVDVGGTSVKLGLFTAKGKLLEKRSIPTDVRDGGSHVLPDTVEAVRALMSGRRANAQQILGVGMGIPGPVDSEGVVRGCVNLGWGIVDVPRVMASLLPEIPNVVAGNDANTAALGELRFGSGKGYRSAVMLTLGTGVGSGVALSNGILSGHNGGAGELGHITVNTAETEPCACGKCGCLEQYASANGLVRVTRRILNSSDAPCPLRNGERFTSVEVCDLAREGDEVCLAALDVCAEAIGRVLSFVACTTDPEVFILGGGLSQAGDVLFEPIRAYYRKYAFTPSRGTPIVLATLGNNAGIFGCAEAILRQEA